MEETDERLLELAVEGDGPSFGRLIRRWESRIFAFICRYVGNADDARDLTQDTFAKAYLNLTHLSDHGRFSSWLYTIALNECRMRFRRQRKVKPVPLEEANKDYWRVNIDEKTPERLLHAREEAARLRSAFEYLPPEQKEVILMKEFQGLKFHEIAEILDIPLSTAKSRMYLGLKTLRRLMEEI